MRNNPKCQQQKQKKDKRATGTHQETTPPQKKYMTELRITQNPSQQREDKLARESNRSN